MARVLLAPDKFKGSLTASQVAAAVGRGIVTGAPGTELVVAPIADGGDGTVAAAVSAGYEEIWVTATGPTGAPVVTSFAKNGARAVVELADVAGLARLPGGVAAPLTATSRGVGEVLAAALDAGCQEIVIGVGGSACTDGGAGLLRALGAVLLDGEGHELGEGGAALAEIASVDLSPALARVAGAHLLVACDVDNPLTGPSGAAAVYGPQKGADDDEVVQLDAALDRWADALSGSAGADLRATPGVGAAGGVAFALVAALGATLRPGIDLVLELTDFAGALRAVDLVVTGEGALDEQTLRGKAPAGVAAAARARGVPVVAVCGRNSLVPERLREAGIEHAFALTDLQPDLQRCIENAADLLEELGRLVADRCLSLANRPA
jgi:glycerate kinase